MSEVVLVTVVGPDRPGITAALTGCLANYNVTILDVGQSVIHDTVSLGMLIELPRDAGGCLVFKDLLLKAHELDLNVRFTPVSEEDYEQWVAAQGQPRHIVTLLGRQISSLHLARVAEVVAQHGLNIDNITRLTGRISLRRPDEKRIASVELSIRGDVPDLTMLHVDFLEAARALEIDIAIQEDNIYRRNRRLVCFDMDSTLIQAEVIDELAREAGVVEQVAAITEAAMAGDLDFAESFRKRMALLEGLDESVLREIAERLPITEGAERLIRNLKRFGYKVAILSGGFTFFAEHLRRKLGIDYVFANPLDIRQGKLTGKVKGEIIDGRRKAYLLHQLAAQEGISLEQVIAVGDGANDLPMLSIVGLGIAFHAKPVVKEQAQHAITTLGLDAILYLLGMHDRDLADTRD
ncbi:phosphoserine phosphatase SerB [Thiohalomonas denitrificans]|uniref:phosphoserine phosphatase SerB n=1 Tax=Thiohalomonas denitrificans TaxID=415747 RepID=UPI0026E98653|nr:phosphoserine phosphatase SerB [Thiohalomonas denitrificans]